MEQLKATTAQEIVRKEKDCDYMDELFGGVKMPPTQVYLKSDADKVIAELEESHKKEVEQLKRALYKACANWAMAESYSVLNDVPTANRWVHTLRKLKAKLEKYK